MKILFAVDRNNEELTAEQIEKDMPQLLQCHQQAFKQDPTWEFFGGTLIVNGHEYQVSP